MYECEPLSLSRSCCFLQSLFRFICVVVVVVIIVIIDAVFVLMLPAVILFDCECIGY